MPAVSDSVWSAQETTPADIEAALRAMLKERHSENESYVPARSLNLVCIVEPRRKTIDAVATIASDVHPKPGEFALLRETVIVDIGEQHLAHVDTIVDPLVVTDLPTVAWAPHGHQEAVEALLALTQVVLLDSIDEPDMRDALRRALKLLEDVYVVDLAWLRSTPWRERVAATFDPPHLRPDLRTISAVTIRHHPESAVAGLLLVGWLASRLNWQLGQLIGRGDKLVGSAHARRQDVKLTLEPAPDLQVRGLAGVTLETASGRHFELDRGPGGLQAYYRNAKGQERRWVVLGASRGEPGILGEGIRQALLRDGTYAPALRAACGAVG